MWDALAALVLLVFAAFFVLSVYIVVEAYYYQARLGPGLERDLGFKHGTRYIRCGRTLCRLLAIQALTPGGPFAQAGFRVGDIIIGPSISGFFRILHRGRGSEARLTVVDGGDGPPLNQRAKRELLVQVPCRSDQDAPAPQRWSGE
jgi:hypothetical protein